MSLGATANRHSTARAHRDRFGSSAVVLGPSSCLLVKSTSLLKILAARSSSASHQTSAETFAWSSVPRILLIGCLPSSLAASTKLTLVTPWVTTASFPFCWKILILVAWVQGYACRFEWSTAMTEPLLADGPTLKQTGLLGFYA